MTSLFALGTYKLLLAPGQCNMKKLPQTPQNQMAKISPKSDATTYILHIFVEKNSRRRGTIVVVEKKSQLLTKLGCVFFVSSSNSPRSGYAVQPLDLPSGCWLDEKMLRICQKVEKKEGSCKILQQPSVVFKPSNYYCLHFEAGDFHAYHSNQQCWEISIILDHTLLHLKLTDSFQKDLAKHL
jgi:hypothetical protein